MVQHQLGSLPELVLEAIKPQVEELVEMRISKLVEGRRLPEKLTVKQAALYANLSEAYIRKRNRDGSLPYLKVGAKVLIDRSELDKFLSERAVTA